VAEYGDFGPFTGAGDCDNPPQLDPRLAFAPSVFTIPDEQEPDIGRRFNLEFVCDEGITNMPFVLGIGSACDPLTDIDGKTYDHLYGLLPPVSTDLVPLGDPPNYATGSFNQTKTIPLKMRLGCDGVILGPDDIDPNPEIIGLRHETLGLQPLLNINGAGANPHNPFFDCGGNRCEYELRTRELPVGTYLIEILMPDSRVVVAGFTIG
jgi:hypothetical protein